MKLLRSLNDGAVGIEAAIIVALGTALFLLLLALPLSIAYELYKAGRPYLGLAVALVLVASIVSVVHDARRRELSLPSAFIGVLWLGSVLYVAVRWLFL
jgi:hypothetical protein